MTNFHSIWKQWHIYNARNYVIYEDGDRYQMLDGVDDWIRHSMKLRALSERKLPRTADYGGWTKAQLVEHLRGDHDGTETYDEEIYRRLQYNGLEGEASKYIPESELDRIVGGAR